jgi:hypothetical protein
MMKALKKLELKREAGNEDVGELDEKKQLEF